MKLTWRITLRISMLLTVVLFGWAVLFHNAIIEEVNDEIDDSLEHFSEKLIRRMLHGEQLPEVDNGTNNTYFLESVTAEYAANNLSTSYSNEVVQTKGDDYDEEPSRVLRTIFRDSTGAYHLLKVATPTVETDELRESITFWIVLLYGSLLVLIIAICLWVLWRSMRPLYRLLNWLDDNDISSGVQPIINPTNVSEFKRLNEAVFRSAKRSEQLYTQQKQFTGNASHEIQTPLAVCQSRLEMLSDTPLSEEQLGEVVKTQKTLEYISRLNKDLLLLTKIDGRQFKDIEKIDIGLLIKKDVEDLAIIFQHRQIAVSVDYNGELMVKMSPMLAGVLIGNLIKNAYVHNHPHRGRISMAVYSYGIEVSNTGPYAALDGLQIFERFYQGNKREGSTGLGLALVKAICDLYGFKLCYSYTKEVHKFSVKFI